MNSPVDRNLVLAQLERVLSSQTFQRAERSSALLRFLVEHTMAGQADRLKEYTIGAEALGRGQAFDPRVDTIVRAEATRLRTRLDGYYQTQGRTDELLISLPKGGYVPQFERRVLGAQAKTSGPLPWRKLAPAALVVLGLLSIALVWSRAVPVLDRPMSWYDVELRSAGALGSVVGTDVILSPDGSRVVFVAHDKDGVAHVYTRRVDQPLDHRGATRLAGTDGARSVFMSPDGRWVGFLAAGAIRKTSVDGGQPVVLCPARDLTGASWGDDGTIIAALNSDTRLWRIPESGGDPELVLDLAPGAGRPHWPQIAPGGGFVIFTTISGDADSANVEMLTLSSGRRTVLIRGGTFGRLLSKGYLTYVNQGTLYAVAIDPKRQATVGSPVALIDEVSYSRTFGYAQVDVSRTGTLVYRRGGLNVIESVDRSGKVAPLITQPGRYNWPRFSPDGRHLAFSSIEAGAASIGIHDLQTNETRRLKTPPRDHTGLMWWPESSLLLFGGVGGLASVQAQGAGAIMPVGASHPIRVPWSVSPDRQRLAYAEMSPDSAFDLWTVQVIERDNRLELGAPEVFLRTPAMENFPSFSPDGRWMAHVSTESGTRQVYVRKYPDDGTIVRVANGTTPRWSPNGNELLYSAPDRRVMVASLHVEGNSLVTGASRVWSSRPLADTGVLPAFDLAPDGERIAVLMPAQLEGQQSPNAAVLVFNFTDEVRRRLSTK